MQFKDYYEALGVEASAGEGEIKTAYRRLARKYHPDVSKEADAEARFKELAEAYEALNDDEKRAAYDDAVERHKNGQTFGAQPGRDSGYEFSGAGNEAADNFDHSDFFEALFGRRGGGARSARPQGPVAGGDHHARVQIDLLDAYRGGRRTITLRFPKRDEQGRVSMQDRQLEVNIPKGIREGQHLRLNGQGEAGFGDGPAGDLYLEIEFSAHPYFRVDGRDIYLDLPIAPWEAALGANVTAPTPDGSVELTVPAGSSAGRKLRLKGKGLPSVPPGDLYAVLSIALPPADGAPAQAAYRTLSAAFGSFDPRHSLKV